MSISDLIESAVASLNRTRRRAMLTMVGIVIGILSVILVLSLGEAAQRFILDQVSSFGSDVIYIQNGPSVDEGQPTLFVKESLTIKDVKHFQLQPWVSGIVGKVLQSDQLTANGFDTNVQLVGTMPDELQMSDIRVERGIFFDRSSVDRRAREIVLGQEIADNAFGAEDPLGKLVRISGQNFRVIGVMESAGTKGFQNIDKQVYAPVTAVMDLTNKQFISTITLKSSLPLPETKSRIAAELRDRHDIENAEEDPSKDDFHVQTQEDLVESAGEIAMILQVLLTSIAAISLLVGGIGIMNIMYVTVTERLKEIGLRKAIGAREQDILGQFLVEAVILTVGGGIIGTVLGIACSWVGIQIIQYFQPGWSFGISVKGIGLGLGVSIVIGLIFGYFPARKAARLTPMAALRLE